jgi:hypothetical protein
VLERTCSRCLCGIAIQHHSAHGRQELHMKDIAEALGLSEHDVAVLRLAIRHGFDDPCQPFEVTLLHQSCTHSNTLKQSPTHVNARRSGSIMFSFSIVTLLTAMLWMHTWELCVYTITYTAHCTVRCVHAAGVMYFMNVHRYCYCYFCCHCHCYGRYCRAAARHQTTTW